ncbi:MAG: hypothetical protein IKJ48_05545 [Alistipes sp.]|jgi:hypothetical protein|nr:hypothetical protein [Rikenellaceae bacterium]MBR3912109.1 hypothetical protein [Alistipes sp.]
MVEATKAIRIIGRYDGEKTIDDMSIDMKNLECRAKFTIDTLSLYLVRVMEILKKNLNAVYISLPSVAYIRFGAETRIVEEVKVYYYFKKWDEL